MTDTAESPTDDLQLLRDCLTEKPEVLRDLDDIASSVRENCRRAKDGYLEGLDACFAIGHDLAEARKQLPRDAEFGAWFRDQQFGFTQQWAWTLRKAADNEDRIRRVVTSQLVTTGQANIEAAVKELRAGPAPRASKPAKSGPKGQSVLKKLVGWEKKIVEFSPDFVSDLDDARRTEAKAFVEDMRTWLDAVALQLEAE